MRRRSRQVGLQRPRRLRHLREEIGLRLRRGRSPVEVKVSSCRAMRLIEIHGAEWRRGHLWVMAFAPFSPSEGWDAMARLGFFVGILEVWRLVKRYASSSC